MSKSDAEIQAQSTRKIQAAAKKALPTNKRSGHGVADWANANPTLVLELVTVVGFQGGAVRYGYTKDGGAYSIGLYLGDQSKTYYCNESEGIDDTIKELIQYFKD